MVVGYKDNLSIDRIDNDKGYSPENCRWATNKEQCRNKTNNRWLELNGERLILEDWAIKLGISRASLSERFDRGWTLEQALTLPKGSKVNPN